MESNQSEYVPFETALPMDAVVRQFTPLSLVLLVVLLAETLLCSLSLPWIAEGSRPPMAISGIVVLSQVGAIGFELCVIAFLFVAVHAHRGFRMLAGGVLFVLYFFANLVGIFIGYGLSVRFGYSLQLPILQLMPLGCSLAGLPLALASLCFPKRVRSQSDLSKRKAVSIRKLMMITAVVAAMVAYTMIVLDIENQVGPSRFGVEIFVMGAFVVLGGVVFLVALEGLNERRNTALFWGIAFGGPALLGLVLTLVVGYWFPITRFVGFLALVAASFLVHTLIFCWTLKSAGFVYERIEIK